MTPNPGNPRGAAGSEEERDSDLDRLYGAAAREAPPSHLDAALVAAARREAGAGPRPLTSRLRSWGVPISIAAVLVVTVSLVSLVQEEGGELLVHPGSPSASRRAPPEPQSPPRAEARRPSTPQAVPAPLPAPESAAPENTGKAPDDEAPGAVLPDRSAAESTAPQPSRAAPERAERQPADVTLDSEPAAPAATTRGALPGDPRGETETGGQSAGALGQAPKDAVESAPDARGQASEPEIPGTGPAVQPHAAPVPPPPKQTRSRALSKESSPAEVEIAALLKEFEWQSPSAWLRRVQELKRQGRDAVANEMLAEFKRRYPAHPLPEGLE